MSPEPQPGENIFEFILRVSQERRESRPQRVAEQCQRIARKARFHGDPQDRKQEDRTG